MYEDGQDEVVFTVDQACQLLGVGLCGTEGGLTVELDVYEVSVCVGGRGGAGRKERFSPSSWTSKRCVCVCVRWGERGAPRVAGKAMKVNLRGRGVTLVNYGNVLYALTAASLPASPLLPNRPPRLVPPSSLGGP